MRPWYFSLALFGVGLALWQPAQAGTFESGNARGMCIDISGGEANLRPCDGGPNQDFDYSPGQTDRMRISGACLTVAGPSRQLYLDRCHKSTQPEQMWFLSGNGQLQSQTGLCADAEGGNRGAGTNIIAYPCNGQSNQRWGFGRGGYSDRGPPPPPPGPPPSRGDGGGDVETTLSPRNASGMCLELRRDSNELTIANCDGHGRQRFTYNPNGGSTGLDVKGQCVTAQGEGQPPLVEDCTGAGSQHWHFGRDGSIRSSATGLCLHVLHADNRPGTPVILVRCEDGAAHQEWDPR